eukprot:COSAG02_NODE_13093_length_1447_cov_0.865727_1_plen_105_part_10
MQNAPDDGPSETWPQPRCGAAMWQDRADNHAGMQPHESGGASGAAGSNSESAYGQRASKISRIWMFAGWSTLLSGERASTELWQYLYKGDTSLYEATPRPGKCSL